jgi:hypothetical protein
MFLNESAIPLEFVTRSMRPHSIAANYLRGIQGRDRDLTVIAGQALRLPVYYNVAGGAPVLQRLLYRQE